MTNVTDPDHSEVPLYVLNFMSWNWGVWSGLGVRELIILLKAMKEWT